MTKFHKITDLDGNVFALVTEAEVTTVVEHNKAAGRISEREIDNFNQADFAGPAVGISEGEYNSILARWTGSEAASGTDSNATENDNPDAGQDDSDVKDTGVTITGVDPAANTEAETETDGEGDSADEKSEDAAA